MRKLTFKGFLQSYVEQLSGEKTTAVARLAERARTQKRLLEPLVLWAAVTGKSDSLARLLHDDPAALSELRTSALLAEQGNLETALAGESPVLRAEYSKVWRSYVARRDARSRDDWLKLEARRRVLEFEASGCVSRYRMAKDLGLNPGNLFAFLAQANPKKLSLDRAYALVDYTESACRNSARGR